MSGTSGPATLIGSPASPYVRKVMAMAELKGVAVQLDPIIGFMGSDAFSEVSPLRRIPVWIDDRVTLSDSSVIAQYLEDRYPAPALFPADIAERARARWLEEYADTRIGDVTLWKLFFQRIIKPFLFRQEADEALIASALETHLPDVCGYIERQLPEEGFLFGELSVADLSIAPFFVNAQAAGFEPDAARWPRLAGWLSRMEAETVMGGLNNAARTLLSTRPREHRAALADLGFMLSERTWGGERPQRGPMSAD